MGYEKVFFDNDSIFLVTGGAGFIGSNICEVLLEKGYRVKCLDNLSTGKKENVDLLIKYPNFEFINGDIRSFDICTKACNEVNYVLHQAAWGSVPRSIELPLLYEEINIKGTLNMLEASRQNKVKKFVYASSSSVYGDEPNLPKTEGFEGNLLSPYALTKKTNEEYAKLYSKLYGLNTYGLRYFNVFGKRQNPDGPYAAVIPKWIKQLINNERPVINGDGWQSRDFTYIENIIEANLKACIASSKFSGESFNIAFGGREYLNDVYKYLCLILNKDILPYYVPERKGDIKHSNASIEKSKLMLGYDPSYDFKKGLNEAIDWYIDNLWYSHLFILDEVLIVTRVLHIVGSMNRGGLETFLMNLYRNIDREKLQFDFIIHHCKKTDYEDEILFLGGKIYKIYTMKTHFFKHFFQIIRIVKNNKYKIVHRHGARSNIMIDLLAAKLGGAKFTIAHSHNSSSNLGFIHFISKFLFSNVPQYRFACSHSAGKYMFGKKDFLVINNGIDSRNFRFNLNKSFEIKKKLGLLDKFVVGHIGTFTHQKNHDFLIDIFSEIFKEFKESILLLVGEGELKEKIISKVKKLKLDQNVIFLGKRTDISDILHAMDIFIFPSYFEGLGIVLIESQANGLITLCSSEVPLESRVTNLISYMDIKLNPKVWAKKALEFSNGYQRNDTYNDILNMNYDILKIADNLQNLYISLENKSSNG